MRHGLLAVTRSDLADPRPALADARARLARSSLGQVEAVAVSGATGAGLDDLRAGLDRLVARLPRPDPTGPIRLWLDRSFTIRGTGTVVTGTLSAGTLCVGDVLALRTREVTVRGLQLTGQVHHQARAVARVALNLRGVSTRDVGRGDVLTTPDAWHWTHLLDVRLDTERRLPVELVLHLGTAAVPVRLRPLGVGLARLTVAEALPVRAGDRAVLRDPGRHAVAAGLLVLDADPPALNRRGAATARAAVLAHAGGRPDAGREIARRGAVRRADLRRLGIHVDGLAARRIGEWLVDETTWRNWVAALPRTLDAWAQRDPLQPAPALGVLRHALDLPDDLQLCAAVVAAAGYAVRDGRVIRPDVEIGTTVAGAAGAALATLVDRLRERPFAAPDRDELSRLGIGARQLAAAVRAGLVLRLGDDVVLLPDAPAAAAAALARLPQPFTTSEARRALDTTRRVAVPLLEHLDALGTTERVDAAHRRFPECAHQ